MIDRRGFLGGLLAIPSGVREFVRKISERQVPISSEDLIYQWKASLPVTFYIRTWDAMDHDPDQERTYILEDDGWWMVIDLKKVGRTFSTVGELRPGYWADHALMKVEDAAGIMIGLPDGRRMSGPAGLGRFIQMGVSPSIQEVKIAKGIHSISEMRRMR